MRSGTMVDTRELKTPCERLKYVREKLLKVSRAEVSKKHGLSVDTLAAWENGKIKLTEKGIDRCIRIYNAENLLVSREWIFTGEGISPEFSLDLNRYFKTQNDESLSVDINNEILRAKDLDYFINSSPNATVVTISNADMLPLYSLGDSVGGYLRSNTDISNYIGTDCIVKTKDKAVYVRRIASVDSKRQCTLSCLNPMYKGNPEPIFYNVDITAFAPIIWIRRSGN